MGIFGGKEIWGRGMGIFGEKWEIWGKTLEFGIWGRFLGFWGVQGGILGSKAAEIRHLELEFLYSQRDSGGKIGNFGTKREFGIWGRIPGIFGAPQSHQDWAGFGVKKWEFWEEKREFCGEKWEFCGGGEKENFMGIKWEFQGKKNENFRGKK